MGTTTCIYLEAVERSNWEYDYYCRACGMKRIGDSENRQIVDGVCHALYEDCDAHRHPGTGQPGLRHVDVSARPKPEKPKPEPEEREKPRPEPEERYEPEKRYGNSGTGGPIIDVSGCLGEGMTDFWLVIGLILGALALVVFVFFKAREILLENYVPVHYALLLVIPLLALLIVLIGSLGKGGARFRKGAVDALATAAALSLSLYLGVYSHWALSLIVPMLMLLLLCCFAAYTRRRLEGDAADDAVQADVDRLFLLSWIVCCATPVFAILEKTRYEKFGTYLWQTILAAVIGAGLAWLTGKMVLYMINEEWDGKAARSSVGKVLMPAGLILLVYVGILVMSFPLRGIDLPIIRNGVASYQESLFDSSWFGSSHSSSSYDDSSYDNSLYDDSSYDNSLYGGSSYGSDASLIEGGTSLPAGSADLVSLAENNCLEVNYDGQQNSISYARGRVQDAYRNEYDGCLILSISHTEAASPSITLDLGGANKVLDAWFFVAGRETGGSALGGDTDPEDSLGLRFYGGDRLIFDTGTRTSVAGAHKLSLDLSSADTLRIELYGSRKDRGTPTRAYLCGAVRDKSASSAFPQRREPVRPSQVSLVELAEQEVASQWHAPEGNAQDCSRSSCEDARGNSYTGYLVYAVNHPEGAAPWYLLDLGRAYKVLDLTCFVADRRGGTSWGPDEKLGLRVYADGKLIGDTGLIHGDMAPTVLRLDVSGVQKLMLEAYGGTQSGSHSRLFVVNGSVSQ